MLLHVCRAAPTDVFRLRDILPRFHAGTLCPSFLPAYIIASVDAEEKKIQLIGTLSDMIQIKPSPEEMDIIQQLGGGIPKLSGVVPAYILVWKAFTAAQEKEKAVFRKGESIIFNIDCSAAKILTQLKAPFSLEVISFDVKSRHEQAVYCFQKSDKIPFENFRVQFQAEAVLSGIFKFQTLLTSEETEHFHVNDGSHFRIM